MFVLSCFQKPCGAVDWIKKSWPVNTDVIAVRKGPYDSKQRNIKTLLEDVINNVIQ